MERKIMCVKIQSTDNKLKCGKQYSNHNMYNMEGNEYSISKCSFVDTYPNFNLEHGHGRIIQYQWNEFLRKIKRYLWRKRKGKEKINKFWKETRKIEFSKDTSNIKGFDEPIIDKIIEFSN